MGLRKTCTFALVFAIALFSAYTASGGAAKKSTTTTIPVSPTSDLRQGGTITVAVPYLPSNFNPSTLEGANPVTQMVMQQVWPQPFVTNDRLLPVTGPGLVVQAEVTGVHPQTVVYQINPNAKWSDGVPITAADFIDQWDEDLRSASVLPSADDPSGYFDINSITGSNHGKTVTVVFQNPFADWESLFSNLVPAHIAKRYGFSKAFSHFDPTTLVSGGPFEITKVIPNQEIVLSRNPTYWGTKPKIAHIDFVVTKSEEATLRGLLNGSIDIATLMPGKAVDETVADSSDLVSSTSQSSTLWQIGFNMADPTTGDLPVREALADVINPSEIVATTVGLYGSDPVATNRIFEVGAPRSDKTNTAFDAPDVLSADKLLEGDGYVMNANGRLLTKSGRQFTLTLTMPTGVPELSSVGAEIKAELLSAGIGLTIRNVSSSALLSVLAPRGDYQMALLPYETSIFSSTAAPLYSEPVGPIPIASLSSSSGLGPATTPLITPLDTDPGSSSFGLVTRDVLGYESASVDSLFLEAASQLNVATASSLYNQIDEDLWSDVATIPLFQMPVTLVATSAIVNVSNTSTWTGPLWDAEDWALEAHPLPTTTTLP